MQRHVAEFASTSSLSVRGEHSTFSRTTSESLENFRDWDSNEGVRYSAVAYIVVSRDLC